ncbi:hypothetical protein ACIRQP_00670 [Streptomyces sp. NPDC102274]|uniref:hypothetical protein n=1 Tax=Streptomyces sp. NPDC102274 TaxID=3366151 RepID=UPI00382D2633
MTAIEAVDVRTPAWRGGVGRLWSAAVVSRFGAAAAGRGLNTPALPAAGLFVLGAASLGPLIN